MNREHPTAPLQIEFFRHGDEYRKPMGVPFEDGDFLHAWWSGPLDGDTVGLDVVMLSYAEVHALLTERMAAKAWTTRRRAGTRRDPA